MTRLDLRIDLIMGPDLITPPHNETETRRIRAYSMLVIVVLVLSSSAIIFTVSRSSLLLARLQNDPHNEIGTK